MDMKTQNIVGDLTQLPSDVKQDALKLDQTDGKCCEKCNVSKSIGDFYKDGRDNTCKDCRKLARGQRYRSEKAHLPTSSADEPSANKTPHKGSSASKKRPLLSAEEIHQLAEAFLLLERWQNENEAHGDLSNSNLIQTQTNK
jgi:hypothetical protein